MPYLAGKRKLELAAGARATTAGDLTYLLTMTLQDYLSGRPMRYEDLAVCLGALEGAKADFINRVVTPYENGKRLHNGDVWPEELLP